MTPSGIEPATFRLLPQPTAPPRASLNKLYKNKFAPSDFFLFPKLKMKLKGRRFQTEEIQAESRAVLNTLRENDFQE